MKHARKLMALLLALVMVLSLSVTAFAVSGEGTDNNGKITIENTVKDVNYSIYRIFDLESFSDTTTDNHEDGAYSYKVNTAWAGFFTAPAEGTDPTNGLKYVTVDGNGYVTWNEGADVAAFAKDAIAYATADATKITALNTATSTGDGTSVEFTELPLGYYLVDSSLGALCALTTTNPNATVYEKNAKPSLTKEVQENSTNEWGASNDAAINDTVNFRATITVQGTAKGYVMHDVMDLGLTFGSVTGITLNGEPVTQTGNYTVRESVIHHTDNPEFGTGGSNIQHNVTSHTFDVEFSEDFCKTLKSGDVIVVSYTATVSEHAALEVAQNSAMLEYKDNNEETHETNWSETKTYTWKFDIFKYFLKGETETPLAGAEFALSTDKAGENKIELTKSQSVIQDIQSIGSESSVQGNIGGGGISPIDPTEPDPLADVTYHVAQADVPEDLKVTAITTTELGKLVIEGLDSGTYYLTETKAPAGYNKLAGPIKVVISDNGTVTYYNYDRNVEGNYDEAAGSIGEVKVLNQAGVELPSTGGMGTTIFYVVGSVLLLGAAVLLVTKKRMGAAK